MSLLNYVVQTVSFPWTFCCFLHPLNKLIVPSLFISFISSWSFFSFFLSNFSFSFYWFFLRSTIDYFYFFLFIDYLVGQSPLLLIHFRCPIESVFSMKCLLLPQFPHDFFSIYFSEISFLSWPFLWRCNWSPSSNPTSVYICSFHCINMGWACFQV